MTPATLSSRDLNRATLARQLLLERQPLTPLEAIERLFGLQAQLARPPFIGLWSRLEGFERERLNQALQRREIVRATSMRATLHLLSAADYARFRATLQPVLDQGLQAVLKSIAKQRGGSIPDLAPLVAAARAHFEAAPCTFEALRTQLLERFPEADERAMGYAVRTQLPLVQVPTDAPWGYPGTAAFTTAAGWLAQPLVAEPDLPGLVRRYLAAFGPASPADMQTWSGLGGLKPVFEAMREELLVFQDERGRLLFDLPESPRPEADTPAPVRFLPDYDNVVMAHDDRSRLIADEHRPAIFNKANLRVLATILVDGRVAGTWRLEGTKTKPVLVVAPFAALAPAEREALADEAVRLVRFAEPGAKAPAVRFD